jgi:formate dehydrogenase iron-sulfur subunit
MTKHKAMLIDITMCVGCNSCQEACKTTNNLQAGEEKSLSATAYTALNEYDGVFVRRMCQHCIDPTCASVCPVGAFTKTPEGPVLYDEDKCIGCRYCMQACPFQVPRYEWSSTYPRIQKCVFCQSRISKGLQPACAEACPTGATKFGDRDELLKEAAERIKADPSKYVNRIYGQQEVGGTSILYITSVPFEKLGFKTELQTAALSPLTWNALSKVPGIVTVGGSLLYGIWWITNRRTEVKNHELREAEKRSNGNGTH